MRVSVAYIEGPGLQARLIGAVDGWVQGWEKIGQLRFPPARQNEIA